jgi:hypothetical protein
MRLLHQILRGVEVDRLADRGLRLFLGLLGQGLIQILLSKVNGLQGALVSTSHRHEVVTHHILCGVPRLGHSF